jgi:hypothetical protein
LGPLYTFIHRFFKIHYTYVPTHYHSARRIRQHCLKPKPTTEHCRMREVEALSRIQTHERATLRQ